MRPSPGPAADRTVFSWSYAIADASDSFDVRAPFAELAPQIGYLDIYGAVGGGAVPLAQGFVADKLGYMASYAVPVLGLAFLAVFAFVLSRTKGGAICPSSTILEQR